MRFKIGFTAETENKEYVSSSGDKIFNLIDLRGMKIKNEAADQGHEYYMENRVVYIELNHGKDRALVTGSKTYDVEFFYKDENIAELVCNCYCTGACKHEFATILQLRDILTIIKTNIHLLTIMITSLPLANQAFLSSLLTVILRVH